MAEAKTGTYSYQTIPHDPLNVLMYQLDNGMRLFMSVNRGEPRVYTNIAFRVGSKHDPVDTTGLAHYMEHMLFKGSSRIGALDWTKENEYLERIADLFEQYRATDVETERRELYAEIDRLSYAAAQLVAPNEYDRLVSAIGAKDTNAYTWLEKTVYVNDLPSNELENWFRLEAERFRHLALRLFHTELETVYEEFNISQDKDFRKVHNALRESLFPEHPYGTQTTLGRPEHLKNPSMRRIEHFFRTYYGPNNMAIVLSGDFDPDTVISWAQQYFGGMKAREIPPFSFKDQPPIEKVARKTVYGQESPYLELAWRLDGAATDDPLMAMLVQSLLSNSQAGLLDLDLNQQQKVLESEAWAWMYEDYSVFGLYGKPRGGQELAEVENLLLQILDKLGRGDFPDWLLEAVIRDMKVADMKATEGNDARVSAMTEFFILGIPWERFVERYTWLESQTKESVTTFVRERLRSNNYVSVYKLEGQDPNVRKVEKPPITPPVLQREAVSEFAREFLRQPTPHLTPVFADFKNGIRRETWQPGLGFNYVYNPLNPLFQLSYIFEMGRHASRELTLALVYLPYLGTSRYTAAELQQTFFRLGLSFEVYNNDDRCYVSLSGLQESMREGLALIEHILSNVQPDAAAWRNVVEDVLQKRLNAKQERSVVLRDAMGNFARYGVDSPFRYRFSADELRRLLPETLTDWIKQLHEFEHQVYYYGPAPAEEMAGLIKSYHRTPDRMKKPVPPTAFTQLPTARNQVTFVHFPMVQTDLLLVSRGTPSFNLDEYTLRDLYNEYFGYGLSSIVFQEIREAKALAYNTYAYHTSPSRHDQAHYMQAYVGTQPDKVADALPAMLDIIDYMPVVDEAIEQARQQILRRVETDRVAPRKLYWEALSAADLGFDHDLVRDIYERTQEAGIKDLLAFHEQYIKDRAYHFLVLGDRKNTPLHYLERYGPVNELSMEELFGY